MQKEIRCSSCKKKITNMKAVTRFNCPQCAKQEIVRCGHCREIVVKYTCPECRFVGPN
ncbi:RNA-binding protein [Candidatus Woesearchaeota archaeon]|nr:RNA-binding protein [Candidatus Woesearchaeota archaeon]